MPFFEALVVSAVTELMQLQDWTRILTRFYSQKQNFLLSPQLPAQIPDIILRVFTECIFHASSPILDIKVSFFIFVSCWHTWRIAYCYPFCMHTKETINSVMSYNDFMAQSLEWDGKAINHLFRSLPKKLLQGI